MKIKEGFLGTPQTPAGEFPCTPFSTWINEDYGGTPNPSRETPAPLFTTWVNERILGTPHSVLRPPRQGSSPAPPLPAPMTVERYWGHPKLRQGSAPAPPLFP